MEIDINKTYQRHFGSGWKQPFRIIKFVRGSNKTKAYIEVYEKSNMAWKQKTKSFVLSEIIADNK
jgi:hypothetical protein